MDGILEKAIERAKSILVCLSEKKDRPRCIRVESVSHYPAKGEKDRDICFVTLSFMYGTDSEIANNQVLRIQKLFTYDVEVGLITKIDRVKGPNEDRPVFQIKAVQE